ncbi:MAG: PAS domain S-box protein [Ferruginibacter sp.]
MMIQFIREKKPAISRYKNPITYSLSAAAIVTAVWIYVSQKDSSYIIKPLVILTAVFLLAFFIREINSLKKQHRLITARQAQLSAAVNNVDEGVIVTDKNNRIHFMNQAAEKITGHMLQLVQNNPLSTIYKTENEYSGVQIESAPDRVLRTGRPIFNENNTVIRNSRLERVIITNTCTPLYNESGDICGTVLVFKDGTRAFQTEKKLKTREKENRDLIQYLPHATYTCDENGFILTYNKAAVVLWGREPLVNREKWCGSKKLFYTDGAPVAHEDSPMAITIRKKKACASSELIIQQPNGERRRVIVNPSPLFNEEGQLTGAVNMLVDITEKKQEAAAARFTEDKYNTLAAQSSEAIFITDSTGLLLDTNERASAITGYSREELRTMNIARLFPKNEYQKNLEIFNQIVSGGWVDKELNAVHKNKTLLNVHISAKKLADGRLMAIVKDNTSLKQTERSLLESEELNTSILTSVTSQIAVIGESGELVTVNKAWKNFGEQHGKTTLARLAKGDNFITATRTDAAAGDPVAASFLDGLDAVRTQKIPLFESEYPVHAKDRDFWFFVRISPFAGNHSKVVVSHVDITEFKNAQNESHYYRFALDQAAIVDVTDSNGLITYVNDNFCATTGFNREEVIGKSHIILDSAYHSLGFYKSLWNTIRSGKVWNGEIKNRNKQGDYFWVNTTIVPCLNAEGKPVKYISIRQDISRRKDAEARMQSAIERYQLLAQATSDTIWDWDIENDTMLYNEGICNMLGYSKPEISDIRTWWKENIHKDDIKQVTDTIDETFAAQKQQVQFEYRFRSENGTYKHIFDRAFVLYNNEGKAYRMIGAMQDVTYKIEEENRIAKAIVDAQEAERQYLGMELHDNINQLLTGTVLMLGAASHAPMKKEEIVKIADSCRMHLDTAVTEIRHLSHRLAPAAFTNSLQEECTLLINELSKAGHFKPGCNFSGIDERKLGTEIKICLYRILQEQLSNISKYARAKNVHVSMQQNQEKITLKIADDGVGFDPKAQSGGIGLGNIKKRAGYFSGTFTLSTAPGKGCCVEVEIPL